MKKVIELQVIIEAWGTTSRSLLLEARMAEQSINTPPPFETAPMPPSLYQLTILMKAACDIVTASVRKGMMNASWFRVEQQGREVLIFHVRDENDDRLFLKFTTNI